MGRTRRLIGSAAVVALGMGALSCSSSSTSSGGAPGAASGGSFGQPALGGAGWTDCPGGSCSWADGSKTARSKARGDVVASSPSAEASTGAVPKGSTTTIGRRGAPQAAPPPSQGAPLASAVDDNAQWDAYLRYRQQFAADHPGAAVEDLPVENRKLVTVVDDQGRPVQGAGVVVTGPAGAKVATLQTYADGRAIFFPATRQELTVTAGKGAATATATVGADQADAKLTLTGATRPAPQIDILFLLDTTGSMDDELDRLKANMQTVVESVQANSVKPRFGLTLYRDRGDLFGTRTFDLTDEPSSFTDALRQVQADGGGDAPEDLTAGLHDALTKPSWRGDDTIKLVILVGDAPPHIDYGSRYADEVQRARAAGIKVVPIGAQGLDPAGEFVFRQLGEQTLGRYVFLVNGPGGGGGQSAGGVPASDLGVLPLDQLVVRLVQDELGPTG